MEFRLYAKKVTIKTLKQLRLTLLKNAQHYKAARQKKK